MKPAAFRYVSPTSLDEVVALLAEHSEDARILAGGQSLVPMMNMRLVQPAVLIDIGSVRELNGVVLGERALRVRANVSQAALLNHPVTSARFPLLAQAMPYIGHVQTRAQGTVCGSVALSDPSAELPLVLMLYEAEVELQSIRGTRRLAVADFVDGAMITDCAVDEVIVALDIPYPAPARVAFDEVAHRRGDFATLSFAVLAEKGGCRVGIGGLDDRPLIDQWATPSIEHCDAYLASLAGKIHVTEPEFQGTSYRRELVKRLGGRLLRSVL
ncbi:MAG: FAD binding domain-containing protein [Pseudomonadota bacterium]